MSKRTPRSEARMPATTCDHDDTLLTQAALHLLPETDRAALAEQLATCGACRERLTEYQTLAVGLRQLVPARASIPAAPAEAAARTPAAAQTVHRQRARRVSDDGSPSERRIISLASPRQRPTMTLAGTLVALLLLALLLGSFWSFGPGRGAVRSPARPGDPGSAQVPVDGALGMAPLACAGAPAPQLGVQGMNGVIGAAPFWVGGFVGSHATLLAGASAPSPYGWYAKIVTHVDGAFKGALSVRGTNLRDNTALWFLLAGATTQTATYQRSAGIYDTGYIFIPTSGCYTLTVSWSTGSWTETFGSGIAVPTAVGAMPASCPGQPVLAPLAANLPAVFGQSPLWLSADDAHAAYHLDLSGDGVPVTFFVLNTFTQTVSLRGASLTNGAPIGFVAPPNPPATVLRLNNSYVRSSGQYTEWQGRAYFPAAGCYALTATWPGGSWTLHVAAGG